MSIAAPSNDESSINTTLDKLENKLFHYKYGKENTDARLERLEKLIFGKSQNGNVDERINALIKAVPNLDNHSSQSTANIASDEDNATNKSVGKSSETITDMASTSESDTTKQDKAKRSKDISENANENDIQAGKYPAITAIEIKLLGKDYSSEPVKERLSRLEKRVLGKASTSDDLSERVDKLKAATGIDVARKSNNISDWIEDEDDMTAYSSHPSGRGLANQDFGNRDIYKDLQRSYGSMGMSTAPARTPFSSSYFPDEPVKRPGISIKSFGLSQQVTALEHEIFGKGYEHDPLPARVNRLESNVFPGQKPDVDKPLPQRVKNLLAKVPIRQEELQSLAQLYQIDPGDNLDADSLSSSAASIKQSRSNLNRIMNSLGNMLSGGMTGSYATSGGNYMLDPNTGMFIDPNTGYVINPNTGAMYGGRRLVPPYGSGNYGYNNYYNNMAPFGMPFGSGSGFGFGGGGFGFGFR